MELEPNGDELDVSYPESGPRVLVGPISEDDEDSDPANRALVALTGRPIKPRGRLAAGRT